MSEEIRRELEKVDEAVAAIRGLLSTPESLAEELLAMVRGEKRRPGEASDDEDAPGAVALELANRAAGRSTSNVSSYTPEVGQHALEILLAAGYWVRWEAPDGSWNWSAPWAMGIPLAEPGWTPDGGRHPGRVQSLKSRLARYRNGVRSPYPFALEMAHYGLDPLAMYPLEVSAYVRETFERALPDVDVG